MNSVELTDKKNQLKIQAEAILSGAEKESRKLTDEEQSQYDSLKNQIAETENEIRELSNKLNKEKKEVRTMENFSLLKAINDVANNRPLDERSQEVVNAGIAEMRKAGLSYSG
jgi:DNA replication initiation complex subunit (GINS family)